MAEGEKGGRDVSSTEAKVLSVLFEASPGTDSDRVRRSGLPRATYLYSRKNLYSRGIVEDRYIPNPVVFGYRAATFLLFRPYAEDFRHVLRSLIDDPGCVVAWSGSAVIFSVHLHRTPKKAQESLSQAIGGINNRLTSIRSDLTLPTVPCYFDFEGSWKRLNGSEGVVGYPRSLGAEQLWGIGRRASASETEAALKLVRRTKSSAGSDRPAHLMGPHTLPRSERKLVDRGWVQWRVLPNMPSFPVNSGAGVSDMVLITGALLKGANPAELFGELSYHCRTFPFLFCTDGKVVLIGCLGTGRNAPPSGTEGRDRRPVMDTLTRHLESIEIYRENVTSLTVHVDHRYDRLFQTSDGDEKDDRKEDET
jgi:hypothetical protein